MIYLSDVARGRENNITLLRLLGALFVLYGHSYALRFGPGGAEDPVSDWLREFSAFKLGLPGIGVSLFFVLSGFLVTRSYLFRGDFLEYAESRMLRIYPALIVAVLFCVFGVGLWATQLSFWQYLEHPGTWNYLWKNSTLLGLQFQLPGAFSENPRTGVNGSLWTLPIEMQMYVYVAILGIFGILKSRTAFNLFILFVIILYLQDPQNFPLLRKPHHVRLVLFFLFGAVAAINADRIPFNLPLLLLLGLVMVLTWGAPIYDVTFSLFLTYLVLIVAFHPRLRLPKTESTGDYSYGIYIYAFPVQQVLISVDPVMPPLLLVLITTLIVVVMAAASWHWIERPCLNYKGVISGYLRRRLFGSEYLSAPSTNRSSPE